MKKIVIGFMVLMMCSVSVFSKSQKYLIGVRLDKIIVESQIENEMKPSNTNTFFDNWYSIKWTPTPNGFDFILNNKSNSNLILDWDKSSFIDEDGTSSKVFSSQSRLIERDNFIPPTNIPFMAKIEDSVNPVDYWEWEKSWNKWTNYPIWEDVLKEKEFAEMKGKDLVFRIVLNIQKGDEIRKYHFFFKAFANKI